MLRKTGAVLLTAALFIGLLVSPVSAVDNSIQILNAQQQISNNGPALSVDYNGTPALVFYGENGIEITGTNLQVHLDTSFTVAKLAAVSDINNDGIVDFMAYEESGDYAAQLFVLSGADGTVISSCRLVRTGYDDELGLTDKNATIRLLDDYGSGTGLVVYDYHVMLVSLADAAVAMDYVAADNIWDAVKVSDVNGDGMDDIAITVQTGDVAVISAADGTVLQTYHLAANLEISVDWGVVYSTSAQLSMWDLQWLDGSLYATSEDGHLYIIDLTSQLYSDIDLGVISHETMTTIIGNTQLNYESSGLVYIQTGLQQTQFFGYRIADVTADYILISCYMMDTDLATTNTYSEYPVSMAVVSRADNSVTGLIAVADNIAAFMQPCLGVYNGQAVVAIISSQVQGSQHWMLYDVNGNVVLQKDVAVGAAASDVAYKLSAVDNGFRVEMYNAGCYTISSDLKKVTYLYNNVSAQLMTTVSDGVIVKYLNNGATVRLAKLASDLTTVVWEYNATSDFTNKGMEFVSTDYDYNGDGVADVLAIVNKYKDEDTVTASYFIIINGKDGSIIRNSPVVTGTDSKKNKIYLVASKLSVVKDLDGDSKKELGADESIIGSKKNKVIGSLGGAPYVDGTLLDIGDANGDGIADYVAVTAKAARLYTSKLAYSYGYASVSYQKTGTAISLDKATLPMQYATVFGDITNDGVKELVFIDYNSAGSQVYRVVNGKTLATMYYLMADGVTDSGEAFMVLPNDINGDGFNEIYAVMNWGAGYLLDGKTGEILKSFNDDQQGGIIIDGGISLMSSSVKANAKLDYIVPFTLYEDSIGFVVGSDYNQDGLNDLVKITSSVDQQNWSTNIYLEIFDAKTMESIKKILLGVNDYNMLYASLANVVGSDRYLIITDSEKTKLIDSQTEEIIATFNKPFKQSFYISEQDMLAALENGTLYKLSYQRSFTANVSINGSDYQPLTGGSDLTASQTMTGNKLYLNWTALQQYSVMTVKDNGNKVYQGEGSELVLPLVEGTHTIEMSMDDGQGKTSTVTFTLTVEHQSSNAGIILAGAAAVILVAAVWLSINRKVSLRKKAGADASELKRSRQQDKEKKKEKKEKKEKKTAQPAAAASGDSPAYPVEGKEAGK